MQMTCYDKKGKKGKYPAGGNRTVLYFIIKILPEIALLCRVARRIGFYLKICGRFAMRGKNRSISRVIFLDWRYYTYFFPLETRARAHWLATAKE